tara:strand:- start:68341 stop:69495 length:1155 start_codon:yes stop_codon:yes gene_type:complete
MKIGIPIETCEGERRVSITPAGVAVLIKAGCTVLIEDNAGLTAGFSNASYEEAGGRIVSNRVDIFNEAKVITQVRAGGANPDSGLADINHLDQEQLLVGFLEPLSSPSEIEILAQRHVTACAMEFIPRTSRAQSMDALSSQANIAGYKAGLMAAESLPKMFPMMMTAAGTITPAHVFVVGVGVAGLQAIATCKRLGAVIQAYDVRPAVKDQVQSVGARFVELELDTSASEDAGGYAQAMDENFYAKQREMMTRVVGSNDVVITTAAVPGKKAPILVTEEMVKGMKVGSVIIDLAAERGGNCELTNPGTTVIKHGVTIVGELNLPSKVPFHASQMYSNNIVNFLKLLINDGSLDPDVDDDIVQSSTITRNGKVVNEQVNILLTGT